MNPHRLLKPKIILEPSRFLRDIRFLTRWGFGISALLMVLLHILKPNFNGLHRNLSEYANGDYGILLILAWLFFAFGLLGLAFQAYRIITGIKLRISFSFLFILCAFSAIILGLFTITPSGTPSNTSSIIHFQTLPIFLISIMGGISLFCIRLYYEPGLRYLFRWSVILTVLAWLGFILLLLWGRHPEFKGMIQRIYALFIWMWFMYISWKITG